MSSVKKDTYKYAIEMANVFCFNPTGVTFGINPKNNRVTSFFCVPYDMELRYPMPKGEYFKAILTGTDACRQLVEAIKKETKG